MRIHGQSGGCVDEKDVEKTMGDALFKAIVSNGTDIVTKDEVEKFRSANSSYTPASGKEATPAPKKG